MALFDPSFLFDTTNLKRAGQVPLRIAEGLGNMAWRGATLPGDAYARKIDPLSDQGIARATDLAGLVTLGSGAVPAERGALRAGAKVARKTTTLPMDEASRLARAKDMGFVTDMPVYHGTNRDFSAFDPAKGGATTKAAPAQLGVWTAVDPEIASDIARIAAKSGGNEQIYPLLHRKTRAGRIRLEGDEKNLEIASTVAQAWDNGYDAILFDNYTTPGTKRKGSILVVRDPSQLRSPTAAFDPAKKSSSDILAVGGPGGAIPGAMIAAPDDRRKSLPDILGEALKNR